MIESITLRDFQRHKKLHIKFGPGVTTLVGDTNAGKSAVFRAVRLLALNKPGGSGQIRHGRKSLKVIMKADGRTLVRGKGESNVYKLDGKVYKSFGMNKVPKDIETLLAVDDVNFQRQMDPPFWFTDTPGQVSRNLNEIVNLEVIDQTLTNVVREVKDAKATMDVTRRRWHEARVKRQELRWVPEMASDWRRVEESQTKLDSSRQKHAALAILLGQAGKLLRQQKTLTYAASSGLKALSTAQAARAATAKREKLSKLLKEAKSAKVLGTAVLPDIKPLLKLRAEGDAIAERRRNLEMLIQEANSLGDEKCQCEVRIKRLTKRLKKISARSGTCPTCGQPIRSSLPRLAICTSH